jgi:putative ABC transport system ATP-binding protein
MLSLIEIAHSFSGEQPISYKNLELNKGENVLISGNSGSGKTTLLYISAGLLKPSSGIVLFNNENIYNKGANKIDTIRGKYFGIIFQKAHLIKNLNLMDNLLAAMYFADIKISKEKALTTLKRLNLTNEAEKMPHMLSQGQAQRAAVAKAIVKSPEIIFADEPTSNLDDENAEAVLNILLETASDINASLIISSHDNRIKPHFNNVYLIDSSK